MKFEIGDFISSSTIISFRNAKPGMIFGYKRITDNISGVIIWKPQADDYMFFYKYENNKWYGYNGNNLIEMNHIPEIESQYLKYLREKKLNKIINNDN